MAEVTLTLEEYEALREMAMGGAQIPPPTESSVKPKRKASAYSKRYAKAFKKLSPRYKLKSGKWKKNGFKALVKAAHILTKSNRKL